MISLFVTLGILGAGGVRRMSDGRKSEPSVSRGARKDSWQTLLRPGSR